jgi:septum formation protein
MTTPAASGRLILASASPRRQSLLRDAGYEFLIHPADLDESAVSRIPNISPEEIALRLAVAKAEAVAAKFPADVVLGADTVVALGSMMLGKADDAANAREILHKLSGTTHRVVTGVAIVRRNTRMILSEPVVSTVEMRTLSSGEIDAYVATNQWQGKAGAYGIQDRDPFVIRTAGCLTNIVGLPMTTTKRLLREAGIEVGSFSRDPKGSAF